MLKVLLVLHCNAYGPKYCSKIGALADVYRHIWSMQKFVTFCAGVHSILCNLNFAEKRNISARMAQKLTQYTTSHTPEARLVSNLFIIFETKARCRLTLTAIEGYFMFVCQQICMENALKL